MNNEYINFKRERDLGELITDTFKFLRENYKQVFKLIFRIAGPVFLILVLALSYYSYITRETIGSPLLSESFEGNLSQLFLASFILLCSILAFYVLLQGVVLNYIRSYVENKGSVEEMAVYEGVKSDFGRILGAILLSGLITFCGLLLIFPGIYFWVPLSLILPLLVFRNTGVFEALGETFSLVSNNWWISFFSLIVFVLLVYIIGLIFQIPLIIYFFIKGISIVQEGSAADPSSLFDWVYVVYSVFSTLAQYLLSTIFIVASAFIYYNLDEKKNFTGSYETISNLGSTENN